MAQSLFKVLKRNHPDSILDVVAPEWSRPLLERMPEINNSFVLSIGHGELNLKLRYQLAKTLQPKHYDQAFILPSSWKSALIPCWAKIPIRTGYRGEMRWGLINDIRILDKKQLPRMVERFIALADEKDKPPPNPSETPIPLLNTLQQNVENALKKFSIKINASQPILALCPGAEFGPSKRWPEEYFAEVAKQKLKEGWAVWLFGSKNDMKVSHLIQTQTQQACLDFTGKTSLGEAIDLLSLVQTVVSNDSGLMHIAAALGRPLIAVYGSTDPGFTPPLNAESKIIKLNISCSPCFKRECPLKHHKCMRDLSPASVLQALQQIAISV